MTDFGILEKETFGVELLGAYHGRVTPPSVTLCAPGMKPHDRLFYVSSGKISFDIHGETLDAPSGSVIYLPCDCEYLSRWEGKSCGYFSVNFILCDGFAAKRSIGERIDIVASDRNGKYRSVFVRMYEIFTQSDIGYLCASNSLFWELMKNLCVDSETKNLKSRYDKIYRAIVYLRGNFQTDVDAVELSAMCGLGQSAFRREFRSRVGTSPVKYRNTLRMKKARELLESGEYSVTEAADLVGFRDVFYFSKLFSREYGESPSSVRKAAGLYVLQDTNTKD